MRVLYSLVVGILLAQIVEVYAIPIKMLQAGTIYTIDDTNDVEANQQESPEIKTTIGNLNDGTICKCENPDYWRVWYTKKLAYEKNLLNKPYVVIPYILFTFTLTVLYLFFLDKLLFVVQKSFPNSKKHVSLIFMNYILAVLLSILTLCEMFMCIKYGEL